jgi:benzoate-CoA ligase family protein
MNAADEILFPALAAGHGDNLAIICGERRCTYNELARLTNRFGNAVLAAGLRRGEPVLMLMKDTPELVAAYLGVMRAGGVSVALNTRLMPKDLAYVAADSRARLLLADNEFLPVVAETRSLLSDFPRVVASSAQTDQFADFLAGQSDELAAADMEPTEPCLWSYTSGTTGQPKGVVHIHGGISLGSKYVEQVLKVQPGMRIFATSKLFFAYALGQCLIGGLRLGATLILYEGWPDATAAAAIIEREQPDVVLSVPALYRAMLRSGVANNEALQRVKTYLSAGERLPEQLCREWIDTTRTTLLEAFGCTETLFLFISTNRDAVRSDSCGRPVPWAEVRLVSEDDREITRPDESGDLWVRIASLFDHYHNRPEATAANTRGGWWRTGDVFTFDADGNWHAQGRSDDMLKISGQWVNPSEVEEVTLTVPGVVEAAVVGAPDNDGLIRLTLFAVAAADKATPELERCVVDTLRNRLSIYKCPRRIYFVDFIPRTATGKLQRFKLRKMLVA